MCETSVNVRERVVTAPSLCVLASPAPFAFLHHPPTLSTDSQALTDASERASEQTAQLFACSCSADRKVGCEQPPLTAAALHPLSHCSHLPLLFVLCCPLPPPTATATATAAITTTPSSTAQFSLSPIPFPQVSFLGIGLYSFFLRSLSALARV